MCLRINCRAYKRKRRVTLKRWDSTFKRPQDRFWVCFTHPDHKDADGKFIPQGYAKISVEILPKKLAEDNANGLGRDAPN